MRKLTFTAPSGDDIELAATFDASMEIADKVADPMQIHRQAVASEALGPAYQPKFAFTVANVAAILHIGHKAAGGAMTRKQINDLTFEIGALNSQVIAAEYIKLFLIGGEVKMKEGETAEPSGE